MSLTIIQRAGSMNKIFKFRVLITLGVISILQGYYSSAVMAQNANELKHMKRQNDSTLLFDGKSYFKALRKAGLSSSEASIVVRNLKAETDTINAVKKLKNKMSKNTGSSGFFSQSVTPSSTNCWRVEDQNGNLIWPGEEYTSNPTCSCYIPLGQAPDCANANIGFEDGTFNGWLGRTGWYRAYYSQCVSQGLNFCKLGLDLPYTGIVGASYGNGPAQHLIVSKGGYDPIAGFPLVEPGSDNNYAARLGNSMGGAAEQLVYKIKIDAVNHFLNYKYAVVLQDPGNHLDCHKPSFSVELYKVSGCGPSAQRIDCGSFIVKYDNNLPGFFHFDNGAYMGVFKPWTNVSVDLLPHMSNPNVEEEFFIKFTTTDCALDGHFGYAYIDGVCSDDGVSYIGNECVGSPVQFFAPGTPGQGATYSWEVDNVPVLGSEPMITYYFDAATTHSVEAIVSTVNPNCTTTFSTSVLIDQCHAMYINCENDCVASFAPEGGKKYVLSAWVKQNTSSFIPSYTDAKVKLKFTVANCAAVCTAPFNCNVGSCEYAFTAKGEIIDGWQRIEEAFVVPQGATEMYVELLNTGSAEAFYDDIRVFPFDGSMKSYVYDPVSQKLLAELDENNYATFYEYDQEGNLVRVKKETERGIKTIKESMSNTSVKPATP